MDKIEIMARALCTLEGLHYASAPITLQPPDAERFAAELLSALTSAGLQVVPVEPTPEMHRAGMAERAAQEHHEYKPEPDTRLIYRAMLKASEQPND